MEVQHRPLMWTSLADWRNWLQLLPNKRSNLLELNHRQSRQVDRDVQDVVGKVALDHPLRVEEKIAAGAIQRSRDAGAVGKRIARVEGDASRAPDSSSSLQPTADTFLPAIKEHGKRQMALPPKV